MPIAIFIFIFLINKVAIQLKKKKLKKKKQKQKQIAGAFIKDLCKVKLCAPGDMEKASGHLKRIRRDVGCEMVNVNESQGKSRTTEL